MNNRFLQALKNRSFFFLWLAEIFAQLAMNMMNFMLILVAYSITHSNTAVSGIVLAFTIPAIIFGILAGVYVDRWDKKTVLFATNILRAGLIFILALTHHNLVFLYSITFIIAIITQFFIPAETPMIPILVKKDQLLSANALFGIAIYGSILVAYALSGPVLLVFGAMRGLIAIALLYIISSLFVALIKSKSTVSVNNKNPIAPDSIVQEIKNTMSVILKVKNLFHAFSLLALSQILIFIIAVIGPGYAQHILGIKIDEFPLVFVTPAVIGMAIGTYFLSNYFHRHKKHHTATAGLFLMAITLFFLPFGSKVTTRDFVHTLNTFLPHVLKINNLHLMMVLAALMGFANALIFVPSNTTVQEETSDEVRGKIYGALNTITALLSLVPVILVGSLADIFGVSSVLIALAIFVAFIAVLRLFL
jgi:MFS family permease